MYTYFNMLVWYFLHQLQNDAQLELERRGFYEQSMKYVLQLQEVQERKKFEFVEIVSRWFFVCRFESLSNLT